MAVAFALPDIALPSRPVRLARLVIQRLQLHPPIDLMAACKAAHLVLREVPFESSVDGCIAYHIGKDRFGILLNSRFRDPLRRRMTLAHEFGHYILHRELIRAAGTTGAVETPELEAEAFEFAMELLMPASMIPWAMCQPEPDRLFRVSRSAWLRRIHQMSD